MKKQFWVRFSVMIAIIVAILTLDITTKYIFDATLDDGKTLSVIPFLFNFKLVHNMGAAWGMLAGKQIFLIALSIVFLSIFIFYYVKEKNKTWLLNVSFGFLIGGCVGNLFDRIFVGYVRDFIQFAFWQSFPIFNFADVALCVGVVLFVIYLIVYFVRQEKREKISHEFVDEVTHDSIDEEQKNAKNTVKMSKKQKNKANKNGDEGHE